MKQPAAIHFDSYEALFRFLHLETGDSFILVHSDLKIIDADEQTTELYGISREDVIGQTSGNSFFRVTGTIWSGHWENSEISKVGPVSCWGSVNPANGFRWI